ncbi:hypothetical protein BHM03_00051926, partial [Ensete ventricosum]
RYLSVLCVNMLGTARYVPYRQLIDMPVCWLGVREGAGEEAEKERRRGEPRERECDSVGRSRERRGRGLYHWLSALERERERDGYLWSIQRGREREDWTPPEGGEGWKEGEGDGDTAALHAPRRDD